MIPQYMNRYDIKNRCLAVLITVLLTLLPGLSLSAPVNKSDNFGEERWFQVEFIIFAHRNSEALESEEWPKIEGLKLPQELVELTLPEIKPDEEQESKTVKAEPPLFFEPVLETSDGITATTGSTKPAKPLSKPVAFELLDEKEFQLTNALKKLQRSPHFDPLLHAAWRQPTYDENNAQTILLYEGLTDPTPTTESEDINTEPSSIHSVPQTNLSVEPVYATEDDTKIGPINPRFAGTISLSVSRYLHFAADLVYRTPVAQHMAVPVPDLALWNDRPYPTLSEPQGPAYQLEEWNAIQGFRLQESRRMRSKIIHYLDHPFMGIVVLVTPVELPKEPEGLVAPDQIINNISP